MVDTLAWPSHSCTLREVGAPAQGVGCCRGPQGVRAEAPKVNARSLRVFPQYAVVEGAVGQRPVGVPSPRRVFQRPEQRPVRVLAVAGGLEVVADALQGQRVGRHVPYFAAFSENPQVGHALAALQVAHP